MVEEAAPSTQKGTYGLTVPVPENRDFSHESFSIPNTIYFQRARMNLISSIAGPEIEPTMPFNHWVSCWSSFNIPFIVFSSCLNSPEWSCIEFSFVFHKRYLLLCLHRNISYLQTFVVWVHCVESTYLCKNLLYLRTPIDWFLFLFPSNQNL